MGQRKTKGLHRGPLEAWVDASKRMDNQDKRITGLLLPFTGVRVNVFTHIYGPDWFNWTDADKRRVKSDDGIPKMKVPDGYPCRKGGHTDPCGDCNDRTTNTSNTFGPKGDEGDEREIPLVKTWKNWNQGEGHHDFKEEPLNLRDEVLNYFAVTEDDIGNKMIGGDGVAVSTVNNWTKDIAEEAALGYERGKIDHSQKGLVPDVSPHDMRGTFVMQLIRNNMQRTKLTKYTGHDHVASLAPYEDRVADETDDHEFLDKI